MIVPVNKVLISVDKQFEDEISKVTVEETGEDVTLYQPIDDDKENKVREYGVVVASCGRITYKAPPGHELPEEQKNLNGHQPILREGDKVYVNYLSWVDDTSAVLVDGKRVRQVDYRGIIAVIRDEEIVPVGNWALLSPIKGEKEILKHKEEFEYDDRARLEYISPVLAEKLGVTVGKTYLTAMINGPEGKVGALYETKIEGTEYLATFDPFNDLLMEL